LNAQLQASGETHQQNLKEIREACRLVRERCIRPRSDDEDTRYKTEVDQIRIQLRDQEAERANLQSKIDGLVTDPRDTTELDGKIDSQRKVISEDRESVSSAAEENQIYRIAAYVYSWFGAMNATELTPEQFAKAKGVFSTFGAMVIALTGSVAALVAYAPNRKESRMPLSDLLRAKVARAKRAYYARRRKPLRIEREVVRETPATVIYKDGKEIVEKPVEKIRYVDRTILIPRFGFGLPFGINPLHWAQNQTENMDLEGQSEANSNVVTMDKDKKAL
jgi:hypothetical protein